MWNVNLVLKAKIQTAENNINPTKKLTADR